MEKKIPLIDAGEFSLKTRYKADDILFLTKLNEHLISVDTEEIFDKLTLLISRYIEIDELKIYHFNIEKKTFRLKISLGNNTDLERSFFLENKPLLAHAIFHSLAVRSPENPNTLYMFLKVNNIPIVFIDLKVAAYERISTDTIRLFEGLINFAGTTLERNSPVARLHSFYPKKIIMRRNDFEKKVAIARRRKRLFGTEYCVLKYKLSNKDFDFFKDEILKSIRETDYIGYDFSESSLLLLFPCTSKDLVPYIEEHIPKYLTINIIK